jgi:hypothetical protein
MTHFANQNEPKAEAASGAAHLSEDQFAKLVELLTPSYLLARFYLDKIGNVAPIHPPNEIKFPPFNE